MLRRAKSFFIKRKKNSQIDGEGRIPVECLTEKTHLARRPIVVDQDRRLITLKEPPDRPDLNTVVRSESRLHDIREKEDEGRSDLRPSNVRRSRPKTMDVQAGGQCRMSFPPPKRVENNQDWLDKLRVIPISKKVVNK